MFLFFSILFFIFLVVASVIALGSLKKTNWGINIKQVFCPQCGEKMPNVRQPTSARQAMWGGWTCPKCGCEMDKWGKEISVENDADLPPKQLQESKTEPIVKPFDERGKTPVERIFEDDKK